ncbi:MAG: hypothetical protein ABSG43_16050 [Solirubrobacteraceae bacterium]
MRRRQQHEQQQPLHVRELRTGERRRDDRQRDERQRPARAAQIAERPGREGEHERGVQQQHARAEHDHDPHPVVDPVIGDEHLRQRRQPVFDRVRRDGNPHVPDPRQRDPGQRQHGQQRDHRADAGRPPDEPAVAAAVAGDGAAQAGDEHRQREQPEQPPSWRGSEQRPPAKHSVESECGERGEPHKRAFAAPRGAVMRPRPAPRRRQDRDLRRRAHRGPA